MTRTVKEHRKRAKEEIHVGGHHDRDEEKGKGPYELYEHVPQKRQENKLQWLGTGPAPYRCTSRRLIETEVHWQTSAHSTAGISTSLPAVVNGNAFGDGRASGAHLVNMIYLVQRFVCKADKVEMRHEHRAWRQHGA